MTVRVTREAEPQIEIYGAYSGELLGSGNGIRATVTFTPTDKYLILVVKGDLDMVQLEAGAFPTSYIPTTGATATRAADICSMATSAFGYNQGAGTIVVEATFSSTSYPLNSNLVSFADSSSTDTTRFWVWSGADASVRWTVVENSSSQADLVKAYTGGQEFSIAGAYKLNDFAVSIDGGSISSDTSGIVTSNVSTMNIGSKTGSAEYVTGHIKSIAYYPRRLSNAQLQALTA